MLHETATAPSLCCTSHSAARYVGDLGDAPAPPDLGALVGRGTAEHPVSLVLEGPREALGEDGTAFTNLLGARCRLAALGEGDGPARVEPIARGEFGFWRFYHLKQ